VTTADLLAAHLDTLFTCTPTGRIARENDPPRSRGPRLFVVGAHDRNAWRIGRNVSDTAAREIDELLESEPPLVDAASTPAHRDRYLAVLAGEAPVTRVVAGVHYPTDITAGFTLGQNVAQEILNKAAAEPDSPAGRG